MQRVADLLMLKAEWLALWSRMTCSLVLPLAPVIITRLFTVRVLCTVGKRGKQQLLLGVTKRTVPMCAVVLSCCCGWFCCCRILTSLWTESTLDGKHLL